MKFILIILMILFISCSQKEGVVETTTDERLAPRIEVTVEECYPPCKCNPKCRWRWCDDQRKQGIDDSVSKCEGVTKPTVE
jgi:hypothetical protein